MSETQRDVAEYQSDHDLLIRLDEKMNGLLEKITPLAADHETRLRALERWRWIIVGIAVAASTLLSYLLQALSIFHH